MVLFNVMVLYHLKFSYEFKVHGMQLNGGMVINFEYFDYKFLFLSNQNPNPLFGIIKINLGQHSSLIIELPE